MKLLYIYFNLGELKNNIYFFLELEVEIFFLTEYGREIVQMLSHE